MTLKAQITEDMKSAMRAKETEKLGVIRLLLSAIKQVEVDSRITLDDAAIITVINKMLKQRRDSIQQFTDAGRQELADKEQAEILILQAYLPAQLDGAEIDKIIHQAITESGAQSMKEMGKVMAILKPKIEGRADMALVSTKLKAALNG